MSSGLSFFGTIKRNFSRIINNFGLGGAGDSDLLQPPQYPPPQLSEPIFRPQPPRASTEIPHQTLFQPAIIPHNEFSYSVHINNHLLARDRPSPLGQYNHYPTLQRNEFPSSRPFKFPELTSYKRPTRTISNFWIDDKRKEFSPISARLDFPQKITKNAEIHIPRSSDRISHARQQCKGVLKEIDRYTKPSAPLPESCSRFTKTCDAFSRTIDPSFIEDQNKRRERDIEKIREARKRCEEDVRRTQELRENEITKLRRPPIKEYLTSFEAHYKAKDVYDDREEIDRKEFSRKRALPKLTSDHESLIRAASKLYPKDEILVELLGVTIARKDIHTLLGLNWLNDEVINFYMSLIVERGKNQKKYPNVYSFNTFFYTKLRASGHSSLKRWTRKVDIFSYDLLIVPVHVGQNHWCLAMVDFENKEISYYDSLGGSPQNCQAILADYLRDESMDKKKTEFCLDGWDFNTSYEQIPQQQNGSDCGVFTCTYAEFLSRRADLDFEQKDMPYFRNKMIVEILTKSLLIL